MAEAIAVLGVVASIVQLIQFGNRVLGRINNSTSEVKKLASIQVQLPVLQVVLEQVKDAIDAGRIPDETQKKILDIVQLCENELNALDKILPKILLESSNSVRKKPTRFIRNLMNSGKISSIYAVLQDNIHTLTTYYTINISNSQLPKRGKHIGP